ncbi:MAG: hypothetical protein GWN84_05335 [Gammaproteobacteria bacterium]|nr:hypothetical protein [Gammaproteobacteria bacterium]
MLLIYGFTLGGRSYGARHHSPWVGSRVWDSCEMFFGDARLLLRYLIFLGYTADEQPLEGLLFFLLKDATR